MMPKMRVETFVRFLKMYKLIIIYRYYINNNIMSKLIAEQYYGNTEYKLKFAEMTKNKIEKYATQLKFRLIEGKGIAYYYIGVSDSGYIIGIPDKSIDEHINIMKKIASTIDSRVEKIDILTVKNTEYKFLLVKIIANFSLNNIFLIDV